jgi:hypothetical protein
MTTGPAMVVANGRFYGERTSYWTNAGEELVVHVTKALSVRTRSVEIEEKGEREVAWLGGNDYQKSRVKGELSISNHRKESISLVIRRRFSGELLSADESPNSTLLEEGIWSVNPRNELKWSLTLQPGEQKTLNYRYSVLVDI